MLWSIIKFPFVLALGILKLPFIIFWWSEGE